MKYGLFTGILVLLTVLAFTVSPMMAQCSKKCTAGACPNVTQCTMTGEMSAVCACGMEFKVTDKTPSIEKDGKKYFVCSEECAEKIKADPDRIIPIMEMKAKEVRKAAKVGGNVMCHDEKGAKLAMCSCGAEMTVGESSVERIHDGETFYFCCEGCAKKFDEDPAAACKAMQGKMCDKLGKKDKGI